MLLREKNYVRMLLCLIITFFLQSSVFALDREAVKWPDLGDHLVRNLVTIESMPVVDCPFGIEVESAEYLVCQVIEHTFYKWKEYEFYNAMGEPQLAIEMIKPEASFLTADEALILLNGSKLCERQPLESPTTLVESPCPVVHRKPKNPVYRTSQTNHEAMPLEVSASSLDDVLIGGVPRSVSVMEVVDEPVVRESVHGTDDRVRITETTNYPWNTVCYISFDVNGGGFRGSGTLVSPHCVLTCGHNVWDQDLGVWSDGVEVTAAQYQYVEGGTVYKPYGTVNGSAIVTNTTYKNLSGGTEYDYGAVILQESFPVISTFMPLQYDFSPSVVNVVGYPGAGPGELHSYSMWIDNGSVIDYEGVNDRIMIHMADTSGGQSGSPVYVLLTGETRRLVAIHCFGATRGNGACRLVSANESIISGWMTDSTPSDNFAYIPYFSTNSAAGRWSGVALVNRNNAGNSINLDYYSNSGSYLGSETKELAANGQISFATDTANGTEGWVKISSTAPLNGLALIGESAPATMFDIDLKTSLNQEFLIPHLAVNSDWNSTAMICNPNGVSATITYKYYDGAGVLVSQRSSTIPANGSVQQNLYTLFQREMEGSMVIESSQPVTVFLLYDNLHTTWRAGLSAVPLD